MNIATKFKWLTSLVLALGLGAFSVNAIAQGAAFETLKGGMKARTLNDGEGPAAQPGQVATIHFIGWLDDAGARGRELYNSHRQGKPVSFVIGTDGVMEAWNIGVLGMRPGGRRMLLVPSAMGYGARGVQDHVPPHAPLMFQIELVALE